MGKPARPLQPLTLTAEDINSNLAYAEQQLLKTENRLEENVHPRFTPTDFQGGQWLTIDTKDWRAGFFNGSEWMMFEVFGDNANGWRQKAEARTRAFSAEMSRPQTHDIGFKALNTYAQALRLTGLEEFKPKIFEAANTLGNRFMPEHGVTKSWEDANGELRVIIDNMMNLEIFFLAADLTTNAEDRDRWLKMAVTHAVTSEKNHIRDSSDPNIDGSTCHVFFYNRGVCKTHQGIADSSTWTRGQAWAMYGYAMAYRYTKKWPQYAKEAELFLATAQRTSDLYLRRLAEPRNGDWIPLHDFDAEEGAPKDTSAAALAAAALIELSTIDKVESDKRGRYKVAAESMLATLSRPSGDKPYRTTASPEDVAQESILLRATTSFATAGGGKKDIERGLSYADYYFLEALLRFQDVYGGKPRAPGFVKAAKTAAGVDVTWSETRGAATYTVKRAASAAGPFETIGTTTEPKFTDTKAPAGQVLHYVVTATNHAQAESVASLVASPAAMASAP
jgi:unsaturated chondroitin disaccharide hydrolase